MNARCAGQPGGQGTHPHTLAVHKAIPRRATGAGLLVTGPVARLAALRAPAADVSRFALDALAAAVQAGGAGAVGAEGTAPHLGDVCVRVEIVVVLAAQAHPGLVAVACSAEEAALPPQVFVVDGGHLALHGTRAGSTSWPRPTGVLPQAAAPRSAAVAVRGCPPQHSCPWMSARSPRHT